ncbi:response regulator [Indioceanicola profundi]|uniref:response regulator n=1 Tax=Indioceanicola profundi TaxID=2220096 RepID=UPI0013C51633|nr:response regulator [Indioceanicola profundi]
MACVVIAEDDTLVAFALQCALDAMGHKVVAAVDTGPAAVQAAFQHQPDLVITDGQLAQGTSGVIAAVQIRELGVPVILASATVDEVTAMDAGAEVFLQKPFSLDRIQQTISDVLASSACRRRVLASI